MLSWMGATHVKEVVEAAGFQVAEVVPREQGRAEPTPVDVSVRRQENSSSRSNETPQRKQTFELPGRPELEAFFNEHVVDIIQNRERYKALGIDFHDSVRLKQVKGAQGAGTNHRDK